MKGKKLTKILGSAIALAAVFALTSSSAFAYRGDPTVQGPNYSAERHDAMLQAFDDGDYDAWVELMDGKGRITEVITEDNFDDFLEIHDLMLDGDTDAAYALRTELGLGLGLGQGPQDGSGYRKGYGRGGMRFNS